MRWEKLANVLLEVLGYLGEEEKKGAIREQEKGDFGVSTGR